MSEPAAQLKAVGAAREELHETAKQALEWVKVSEERVAQADVDGLYGLAPERAIDRGQRVVDFDPLDGAGLRVNQDSGELAHGTSVG